MDEQTERDWIRNNLGIWGNSSCVQCGACCYEQNLVIIKKTCENQEIRDGKSYCLVHDNSEERTWQEDCERFFCGKIADAVVIKCLPEIRERLRGYARKFGTVPEGHN